VELNTNLNLNLTKTALVIIDLQNGVVNLPTVPYSTSTVVSNAAKLAEAFRAKGAFVVAVNVDFLDGQDALKPVIDQTPQSGRELPKNWAALVPEIDRAKSILITKRQWGAFYGTELDLQLRRRGIDTIVLCGIATNIGVGVTAVEAYQHGYQQIFVEDAMSALSEEEHRYSMTYLFPRMGQIRKTVDIVKTVQ
jgi:nicotinamidase-related amidase